MNTKQMHITIENVLFPVDGVVELAYKHDFGWFFSFKKGQDIMGNLKSFYVFNGFVIEGSFTFLSNYQKNLFKKSDYLFQDVSPINYGRVFCFIENLKDTDFQNYIATAINHHPSEI